ncbi:MAG: iron-sulfur cluster assembly scaffold protein [Methanosarcinales archaeon]|nr:iron-sulfur cluster assembly scaffold protein [Methanosarcinales archaeon]
MDKRKREGTKIEEREFSYLDELIESIEERIKKEEREIYTERTLKEAYNPKNVGELNNPDGAARITGPCGDTVQIHLQLEGDRIIDSKFITDGCGALTACGSVVTEMVRGKTIEEAFMVEDKDILSTLGGLPEENVHCALLAANTLRAALENYKNRNENEKRNKEKGGGDMKLCIPTLGNGGLDDLVSEHFGRAPTFTVVDMANSGVKVVENTGEHFGGVGNTPELVAGAGAEIMLCSGLGPRAISMFEQLGIEVYVGASGTVQDAINAFQAGELLEASDANACKEHRH